MVACCALCTHIKMMLQQPQFPAIDFSHVYDEKKRLHKKMCSLFGVPMAATKKIVSNLEDIGFDGGELYKKMKEISEQQVKK